MALPALLVIGGAMTIGKTVMDTVDALNNIDDARFALRQQKLAIQQSIQNERNNAKIRESLRQARLNQMIGQVNTQMAALNVVGGPSLAAMAATLAHGASLEQAWDAANVAAGETSLRLREIGMERAESAFERQQYINIAGSAMQSAVDLTQLTINANEASKTA